VVDAFLTRLVNEHEHESEIRVARGQCIEQYGAGEAYMPVLEALERLGRTFHGEDLKQVLRQHAPTWLAQLPTLLNIADQELPHERTLEATRERMLRELAQALEELTSEQTLVLVLEDLHWADASTLALLALLARRPEPARILVIGTYRPMEVSGDGHPLNSVVHELHAHGLCHELPLQLLKEQDLEDYLQQQFPHCTFPARFAELLHRRTEGNPLFFVNVIAELVARGTIVQIDERWVMQGEKENVAVSVPESIRHLVARQRERLAPEDQQVLEAASMAGMKFSAAAVAAALEAEVVAIGGRCARLAERQQFLRPVGIAKWPDGTVAARYGFIHALYQHLWHERVSIEQQQQWHLRIGERKEAAYGSRAREIAMELAVHFEQGRDYRRAVAYLQQAGENALRRSASAEAISHLTRALELLKTLPDTRERAQRELTVQVALGAPLMMTKGYTAPEVKAAYERARELCQEVGETSQLFPVLVGLSRFYYGRNSSRRAIELREQLLSLAQSEHDPSLLLVAHMNLGGNLFFQGEFARAHTHAEQGITLYDPRQHRTLIFLHGDDPKVTCGCWSALALWYLGYPDQALGKIHQTLRIAQELAYPFGLAFALFWTAFLHQARGEVEQAQERAAGLMAVTQEHGIPQFSAMGAIILGWTLAEQGHEEGLAQLQQGIAGLQATRQGLGRPYFLALLTEAYRKRGRVEEGIRMLAEALDLADKTGECMHQAELYRLKGLTLNSFRFQVSSFKLPTSTQRRRSVFCRLSRLPASNKRSPWSCGRQ
jgi:tetratricopeptide (TPR) repeat protein